MTNYMTNTACNVVITYRCDARCLVCCFQGCRRWVSRVSSPAPTRSATRTGLCQSCAWDRSAPAHGGGKLSFAAQNGGLVSSLPFMHIYKCLINVSHCTEYGLRFMVTKNNNHASYIEKNTRRSLAGNAWIINYCSDDKSSILASQ